VSIVLFSVYNYSDGVNEDEMSKIRSTHEEEENACRILVERPDRKEITVQNWA
jgi:hypothetical protein